MTQSLVAFTPLERLQLRENLQDLWREHVRRITELSIDLHTALDAADDNDIDAAVVGAALSDARLRLVETEQAMRRLDDRSYGRCHACLMPLPFTHLVDEPDARHCSDCRAAGAARRVPVAADAR